MRNVLFLEPEIRLISCKVIAEVPPRGKPMQVPIERGIQRTSETFSPDRRYLSKRITQRTTEMGSMRCFVAIAIVLMCMLLGPVTSARVYYTRVPDYCLQPPPRSESLCTIDIEGFYYDPRTDNCERYEVGGCRAIPGQSFGSRDDCLATCKYRTRRIQDLYTIE